MARSLRERWFEGFIQTAVSRPWYVLLICALLAAGGMALASRLEFRGSFVELLPQGAREVQDLTRVSQKAGGDGYLVIVAKGDTPERLKAYASELKSRLEALPEVRYVEHSYDVEFFRRHGLLLLPAEKLVELRTELAARVRYERQQANPFYIDLGATPPPPTFEEIARKHSPNAPVHEYLANADGTEVYLMLKPMGTAGDLSFARRFVELAMGTGRTLASERFPAVKLEATGNFQNRIEEDAVMRGDLSRAGMLSALIAVGLILLATRRIAALAVVGVPVVVGLLVTFGVAQLAIGHLNVVTGFLVAILIGLGIEYGVHLCMRYWEERRTRSSRDALAMAVRGTFSGALTSAVTNAAAFFVLLLAQFHAFNQFGFLAGLGVLLAVIAAYALGPSLLAIAERLRPARKDDAPASAETATSATPAPAREWKRWPTPVIALLALLVVGFAAFSVSIAPRLGFETDMRKLKGDSPASRLDDHVTEQLGQPLNPAIFLVDDLAQVAKVEQVIAEVKQRNGADSVFLRTTSLNDLVPGDLERREKEIAGIRALLQGLPEAAHEDPRLKDFEQMVEAKPYGLDSLPVEVRRRFLATDGQGTFLLLFPSVSNYDTDDLKRWAAQIDQVVETATARGVEMSVLDSNRIAARIFALVRGDGLLILCSAAAVVFVVILLSLRSLKRALLVTGPLFLGMTCLAGGMYLFDVQLNFINAVVLPNLLAIAVDNSIHLYHRYEEEGPGSLGKVVRHTGLAAVVATLSNAAGYGALLVANHQGLRSIGQIALLGVVCTFLGTTVFFPALLALLERWKERQGSVAREGAVVRSLELDMAGQDTAPSGERKSA
ncbi:efflux RND transporter permease subunit [Myxococcus llanfairpwllgwyngyllgogerychwyrndrobwllllantysiliogogogochensis]|uniref:efflux RND transporter permease subunit n=1 Tax=Myxococcus llanfairpwllgwyngyllgogerychwyrndrobwllllantysiliogogogochensis TaxID=2590453 RepID=UPI0015F01E61|nr:MMPL family transporter [Myxococcus llanfairpwllgwyngyllgogerychwyrndrobwllllantysiliogogogochensis]